MALFLLIRHNLKITELWISIWDTNTMLNLSFMFLCLLMQLLMLLSYWTLAACRLTLKKNGPNILMHIKHCLNSAKGIAIQEAPKLHCVDAAASDAEHLCEWCLASPVGIVWEFLFQNLWIDTDQHVQYAIHVLLSHSTVEEEEFVIHVIEICCKSGMLIKSCRYWLLNLEP